MTALQPSLNLNTLTAADAAIFDTEPTWGPIGREVFERTYSRTKTDGSNESWVDTVVRVAKGNTELVPARFIESGERSALEQLIFNMHGIPAGRHLWASGVEGRQFLSNCFRAPFTSDISRSFCYTFDHLMVGGGVGSNYSSEYLVLAPKVDTVVEVGIYCNPEHPDYAGEHFNVVRSAGDHLVTERNSSHWDEVFTVPDSREGWVEALEIILTAATCGTGKRRILIDVSGVRHYGQPIKGFGGTASGPAPLVQLLVAAPKITNTAVGRHLNPIEAMLVDHEIAQVVVAGNVRRSARMSILHWNDSFIFDFIHCKDDPSQHWTTNISVEVDDLFFDALGDRGHYLHQKAQAVFDATTERMYEHGEPGFYNSSLAAIGERDDVRSTNPCGEIALSMDGEAANGLGGADQCTLGHINLAAFDPHDIDGLTEAFRLMTRYLVRATFGDKYDLGEKALVERNRRIGVGFFGYQEFVGRMGLRFSESHRSPELRAMMRLFYRTVREEADRYADELGIPYPIKVTTIAPTGTIAQLGGFTQGLHPAYALFYNRLVRYANNSPQLPALIAAGYRTEPCVYSSNTTVVYFPTKDNLLNHIPEELAEDVTDIALEDFLAVQAMVQEEYADNAISFTINFDPEQVSLGALREGLTEWLPKLKGTTVFPDKSRPQSPFQRASKAEIEMDQYLLSVGSGPDACGPNGCPVK